MLTQNKILQLEARWQQYWQDNRLYQTPKKVKAGKKRYVLSMFPYPSGAGLHVGHVRIYTGTDVLARFFRMKGYAVLHPMGWDAFGLPAENAAIKAKKNPMDMVPKNIINFKRQMQRLGFSYDWDREFATIDPDYYKWTQWLFIQFFKRGLLYKQDAPVYFCPFCKTGLAEEEVLPNGTHERCGKTITRKLLPQWIFRITSYADRLLEDLKGLDWPKGILEMQKNWIGKREGINIAYKVEKTNEEIVCFTTRPDTNFGATFIVVAPEHRFVDKILKGELKTSIERVEEIKKYVEKSLSKTEVERMSEDRQKTGVFTGFYARNKLNNKLLPIWISDFVLLEVGTGAVVGVPGHDKRDFEFAKTFNLPVVRVVVGSDGDSSEIKSKEQVQEKEGVMINSDFLNGLDTPKAIQKMIAYLEAKGWGKKTVDYHLRDWIFSRQRYWGEPIPMVYCGSCAKNKISYWDIHQNIYKVNQSLKEKLYGWFPIEEDKLPLRLPYLESYEPSGSGESPLSKVSSFVNTNCPYCGSKAKRETDTMPNWAGSCWYFLRFADPRNSDKPWDKEKLKSYLPVDWYLGGAEHAVLHLLYSRFWTQVLFDMGLVDFKEPFLRLRNVGMVLAEDHRKMSKSFGNVISPDEVVNKYGADTLRVYEMFMAPFNMEIAWSMNALQGAHRFLKKVYQLFTSSDKIAKQGIKEDLSLVTELQKTILKIEKDISDVKFNTAISSLMKFVNLWEKSGRLSQKSAGQFLQLLSPFAPFLAEELWQNVLGKTSSISLSKWPQVDKTKLVEEVVRIPVQVDGKLRAVLSLRDAKNKSQQEVENLALKQKKVLKYLKGKNYQVRYIQGRIISFSTI